jgi:hypothetical protein
MNPLSRAQSHALQANLFQHASEDLPDLGVVVLPRELPKGPHKFVLRRRVDKAEDKLVGDYTKLSDDQLHAQLLHHLAHCDADEADNPQRAQRAADRVFGRDRAIDRVFVPDRAANRDRSVDPVFGRDRSVDPRIVAPIRMPAISRDSGITEEQLRAQRAKWAAQDLLLKFK